MTMIKQALKSKERREEKKGKRNEMDLSCVL